MFRAATLTRKPKNKNEPHQLFNPSAHWIKHYSIFPRAFICVSHQLSHTVSVSDAEAQMPVKPPPSPPQHYPEPTLLHPAFSSHFSGDDWLKDGVRKGVSVNIFGGHTPCGGMLGGNCCRRMGSCKCAGFDHNTFSAAPQIDLSLLNFGPSPRSAGQQSKSKANRPLGVPNAMVHPCCASKQHPLPLHLCSLRYHSLYSLDKSVLHKALLGQW